jgi:hypothetical protein
MPKTAREETWLSTKEERARVIATYRRRRSSSIWADDS